MAAKAALSEFEADLQRVDQLLQLIQNFRGFAATVELSKESDSLDDVRKLYSTARAVRTDLPVLAGSLLLYICGRFENFARELVGTIVDDLLDQTPKYEELPEPLRKEFLTRTLTINLNPGRFGHSASTAAALAADLVANIGGTPPEGTILRMDPSIITATDSNMNADTLAGLFKRVGRVEPWTSLVLQSRFVI